MADGQDSCRNVADEGCLGNICKRKPVPKPPPGNPEQRKSDCPEATPWSPNPPTSWGQWGTPLESGSADVKFDISKDELTGVSEEERADKLRRDTEAYKREIDFQLETLLQKKKIIEKRVEQKKAQALEKALRERSQIPTLSVLSEIACPARAGR